MQLTKGNPRRAMTVTINLSPETEQQLQQRAAQTGQTVESFVRFLIEKEVRRPDSTLPAAAETQKTFDEILAPVQQGFAESGLSDAELEALFKEAREEVWNEKRRKSESP
jgi:predicted DNA-binding protein